MWKYFQSKSRPSLIGHLIVVPSLISNASSLCDPIRTCRMKETEEEREWIRERERERERERKRERGEEREREREGEREKQRKRERDWERERDQRENEVKPIFPYVEFLYHNSWIFSSFMLKHDFIGSEWASEFIKYWKKITFSLRFVIVSG